MRLHTLFCLIGLAAAWPVSGRCDDGALAHRHREADTSDCPGTGLACAGAATAMFDRDGSLLVVWAANGRVSLARSMDGGHAFGPDVALSPPGQHLDSGPDGRPVLAEDGRGRIAAAWAVFKDDRYDAQIFTTSSSDGGRTFSPPRSITEDPTSQRFPTLIADGGRIFAAWIDKRTAVQAKAGGQTKLGAALAFAWSDDGGRSFGDSRIFKDDVCECCRLGLALNKKHRPVVLFRNLYPDGVRDHAVVVFGTDGEAGPAVRVSRDQWAINGCPHHGPSLSIGSDGAIHAAWFTQGPVRQGLFYARSDDGGQGFGSAMALSTPDRHPARPAVLAVGRTVWLAWKEFDGHATTTLIRTSADGGRSWSPPAPVAATAGASDHPLLIADGKRVFLSWLRHDQGYGLFPVGDAP